MLACRKPQLEILRLTEGTLEYNFRDESEWEAVYAELGKLTGLKELDVGGNRVMRDHGDSLHGLQILKICYCLQPGIKDSGISDTLTDCFYGTLTWFSQL